MSVPQLAHTRHRSGLDLLECRPEVLDSGDMRPELVQLGRRKTVLGGGYRDVSRDVWRRVVVCLRADTSTFDAPSASASTSTGASRCVLPAGRRRISGPKSRSAS